MRKRECFLTGHGAASSAASEMVDDGGITLDNSFYCEVAAEARVGDLIVLEELYGCLHGLDGGATGLQDLHSLDRGPFDIQ